MEFFIHRTASTTRLSQTFTALCTQTFSATAQTQQKCTQKLFPFRKKPLGSDIKYDGDDDGDFGRFVLFFCSRTRCKVLFFYNIDCAAAVVNCPFDKEVSTRPVRIGIYNKSNRLKNAFPISQRLTRVLIYSWKMKKKIHII